MLMVGVELLAARNEQKARETKLLRDVRTREREWRQRREAGNAFYGRRKSNCRVHSKEQDQAKVSYRPKQGRKYEMGGTKKLSIRVKPRQSSLPEVGLTITRTRPLLSFAYVSVGFTSLSTFTPKITKCTHKYMMLDFH